MHKNIKWNNKSLPGVSWDDLNKITNRKAAVIEAHYAKTDFLALKPELVHKLAEPFFNPKQMINFKGDNQKQIKSAGILLEEGKISRPEHFDDPKDYKTRASYIDYQARNEKINWENRNKKICKSVLQYDKEGNFIKEFDSAKTAAKELNLYPNNITSCCKGNLKSTGGFIWKYKE